MIKNVFFDLDGTLLPMNQDEFISNYMKNLSIKMAKNGYEPKKFLDDLMTGTYHMIKNDGILTNEQVFWNYFNSLYDTKIEDVFNEFYNTEFKELKNYVQTSEYSKQIVKILNEKGYNVFLSTNPIFPSIATHERMSWVGLSKDDFKLVTTYENSKYAKPNLKYFNEILEKFNLKANETIMIGNDMADDFRYLTEDFSKLLVTDCLINEKNVEINIPTMTLKELYEKVKEL